MNTNLHKMTSLFKLALNTWLSWKEKWGVTQLRKSDNWWVLRPCCVVSNYLSPWQCCPAIDHWLPSRVLLEIALILGCSPERISPFYCFRVLEKCRVTSLSHCARFIFGINYTQVISVLFMDSGVTAETPERQSRWPQRRCGRPDYRGGYLISSVLFCSLLQEYLFLVSRVRDVASTDRCYDTDEKSEISYIIATKCALSWSACSCVHEPDFLVVWSGM